MSLIYRIILQGHHAASDVVEATGGAHEESHDSVPHLQNLVTIIAEGVDKLAHNAQASADLINWVNVIYSIAIMIILLFFFSWVARRLKREPGRLQNAVEMGFSTLDNFVQDVLGAEGRKYVPLVGTLFIYIIAMNLFGLVPVLGHSPSSSLNITLSLALFVFITVQIHGMRSLGFIGYLRHFADLPDKPHPVQIILSPLMFFLHVIGELAKPVSLSLRLFGNITGEDVLIAVFVLMLSQWLIPLQLFVYPIALLGSFIQALVFALLTTVYILLMSPHKEEH